ncbi:MAG: DnaJ domain-containing protein [Anaerolineae bacterium]|nr:DnaJ domain-containing protein [Anaerolineae bacterium]
MLRFDTHNVRAYLLWKLTPHVARLWHDDSDIVLAVLHSGEKVMFHLNERFADLHDIKTTLANDMKAGRHTLMMFWADMLLPGDGERMIPNDWMSAALALYDDKIYAFDIYARDVHVFPIYFEKQAGRYERFIRYGQEIDFANLHCQQLEVDMPTLKGTWKVASFYRRAAGQEGSPIKTEVPSVLHEHYRLLKLELSASMEEIKKAYREMARQFHPDLNPDADSNEKMKKINEAYQKIIESQ